MVRLPEPEVERRIPRQQRAQLSCAAIFDAAAALLQRDGIAGLSTNRIAEQAGVSIGTLYQYFPNKQAVLLAMGRRDLEETAAQLAAAADVDAVVACLVARFPGRRGMRRVLLETVFHPLLHHQLAAALDAACQGLAPVPEATRYVLTRALLGVLRAAVLEEAAPEPAALARELRGLMARTLAATAPG